MSTFIHKTPEGLWWDSILWGSRAKEHYGYSWSTQLIYKKYESETHNGRIKQMIKDRKDWIMAFYGQNKYSWGEYRDKGRWTLLQAPHFLSPSISLNFSGSPFMFLPFSFYNPSPPPAVLLFSRIFGVIPVPSACISAILWSWGQTLGVVLPVQASQLAINVADIRWEES